MKPLWDDRKSILLTRTVVALAFVGSVVMTLCGPRLTNWMVWAHALPPYPSNTAHAWHAALQARVPQIELLHMPRETAAELQRQGQTRVALLATQGTYRQGLYDAAFAAAGITCVLPDEAGREALMQGIYDGVKAGNLALAQERFASVGAQLRATHGNIPLVMACTEIPLALPQAPAAQGWPLVDPTALLAAALARKAYHH